MLVPEQNPFEVLHLDPTATEADIVRRANRLCRRTSDEAALAEVRQAVQALTGSTDGRMLLALLTHPRPRYETPALARLVATFRRPSAAGNAVEPCPAFDFAEFAEWIGKRLVEDNEPPPLEFEALHPEDSPEEIQRQSDEALWQSLIYDPRA